MIVFSAISTSHIDSAFAAPQLLTINGLALNGAVLNMYTTIRLNGALVQTGFTPFSYTANGGSTYTIAVSNYQNYVFDHWNDGTTSSSKTITITQPITLTAYFRNTAILDNTPPVTTATPPGGSFTTLQSVVLSTGESGTTTYYTTNGIDPTTSSTVYTSAIPIPAGTTTLKFRSIDASNNLENVKTQVYTITVPDTIPPVITASPTGGTYGPGQSVILSSNEPATIYYTTDGSTPNTSSSIYNTAIPVATTILKYFGVDTTGNPSSVVTQNYVVSSYPITYMSDTPTNLSVNFGSLISAPRQLIVEHVSPTSQLVGKKIDSITMQLQKVGSPTGTAQVGIFNTDLSPKKIFGTINVATISTLPTNYEFKLLASDPLYNIVSNDRIGFKYTGGSSTVGVNVTPDRDTTDQQFDGLNSYRERYETAWVVTNSEDMYMILKQTHGNTTDNIPPVTTATPPGGSFASPQTVTLSTGESGTTTYFTTNGTDPTTSSPVYSSAISIPVGITNLKFRSIDTALNLENVKTQVYNVTIPDTTPPVAPVITNSSLTTKNTMPKIVGTAEANSTVKLFDGATQVGSTTATGGVWSIVTTALADGAHIIKANATDAATNTGPNSNSITVTVDATAPTIFITSPTNLQLFTTPTVPASGNASDTGTGLSSVTWKVDSGIASPTVGMSSWSFTTPSLSNGIHTIFVNATDNAGNVATKSVSFNVTVDTIPPITTATPLGGSFTTIQNVILSTGEAGTITYFTTNGTDLTTSSTIYTSAIPIPAGNTTLKFRSIDASNNLENIQTQVYNVTLDTTPPVTTATPAGGSFSAPQNVTLSTGEAGTITYFTTNGTDPTTSSPVYSSAIPISTDTTLKFRSIDAANNLEDIQTQAYTITIVDSTSPTTTATPAGGSFTTPQTVTLSTGESGTTTYFTTNGTDPTTSSPVYSSAISIPVGITNLKFRSIDASNNLEDSKTEVYNVTIDTIPPITTATPPGGSFTTIQNVILSTGEIGTTTYFTTNGTDPTTSSPVYSSAISIPAGITTLKFRSVDTAFNLEDVKTQVYNVTIPDTTPPTTTSFPIGGLFTVPQSVTLSTGESGTITYFTLNGTDPTTSSPVYTSAISISSNTTLKFRSMDSSNNLEDVRTQTYTFAVIDSTPPTTTATPAGGSFTTPQNVTLSTGESGTTTYYTTNGIDPTNSDTVYSSAIPIPAGTTTLKFRSIDTASNLENVKTQVYLVTIPDNTPPTTTATPAGGSFTTPQTVTLSTGESGTITYYTTNGIDPTTSSPVYSADIPIPAGTTTLKFRSMDASNNLENVRTQVYIINIPDITPPVITATPAGNTYGAPQSVTLSSNEPATIYYTTNGATPNTSSNVADSPITISVSTTLKYFGVDTAGNPSSVVTQNYVILPIIYMSDTPTNLSVNFGSLISSPRQLIVENVTPSSILVGAKINSITLKLQKVGSPTGTAQVGIFNADLSLKKLFKTINVATINTAYTDYEFNLNSTDPLYTISANDLIGFKYTGGSSSAGVNVIPDRDTTDPQFDGINSYRQRYESTWVVNQPEDMYMILQQKLVNDSVPPPPTSVTLKINATNLSGAPISGVYTTIKTGTTVLIAQNTPITYGATTGITYTIRPSPHEVFASGIYDFDHWSDGNTNVERAVTLSQSTTFTALYKVNTMGTRTVTINSANMTGALLPGIYTNITPQTATITPGYTPRTYTLAADTTYTATPQDYGNYVFDHWNDGNTTRVRSFIPTQPIVLTAYFKTVPIGGDVIAPVVNILAPTQNKILSSSSPTIYGTASDNIGIKKIEVSVDGGPYKIADGLVSWSKSMIGMTNGTHTATVRASDNAGNSNSATVTFSLNINPLVRKTGIYIPMYIYPSAADMVKYDTVAGAKLAHPSVPILATVNPSSGPGVAPDTNYVTAINKLKSSGVIVIGYVFTKYGSRDIVTVESEIDKWITWYHVDGIHLDELANDPGYENYYRQITAYGKSHGLKLMVGNAGTDPPESYVGTVDMIIVTEGDGYNPTEWMQYCITCLTDGWHYKYDKNNFISQRYAINTLDTGFELESSKWSSFMYLTDGVSPVRWDHISPYLNQMLTTLDIP